MRHTDLVLLTLKHFQNQLNDLYVDITLDESDQEMMNLNDHIMYCSEDWELLCYTSTCGIRPPQSIEDMIDYIQTSLRKVG